MCQEKQIIKMMTQTFLGARTARTTQLLFYDDVSGQGLLDYTEEPKSDTVSCLA